MWQQSSKNVFLMIFAPVSKKTLYFYGQNKPPKNAFIIKFSEIQEKWHIQTWGSSERSGFTTILGLGSAGNSTATCKKSPSMQDSPAPTEMEKLEKTAAFTATTARSTLPIAIITIASNYNWKKASNFSARNTRT